MSIESPAISRCDSIDELRFPDDACAEFRLADQPARDPFRRGVSARPAPRRVRHADVIRGGARIDRHGHRAVSAARIRYVVVMLVAFIAPPAPDAVSFRSPLRRPCANTAAENTPP